MKNETLITSVWFNFTQCQIDITESKFRRGVFDYSIHRRVHPQFQGDVSVVRTINLENVWNIYNIYKQMFKMRLWTEKTQKYSFDINVLLMHKSNSQQLICIICDDFSGVFRIS